MPLKTPRFEPALDLLGEKALDRVEPGGGGWGERVALPTVSRSGHRWASEWLDSLLKLPQREGHVYIDFIAHFHRQIDASYRVLWTQTLR